MKLLKRFSYLLSIIFFIGPLIGCGIFDSYEKNKDGYYEKHFNCCGPIALEKAINRYYRIKGIVFARNPAPREEISKKIQDDGIALKEFLSFFNKQAICITWPSEIKKIVEGYGFEIVTVNNIKKLDPKKHVAIVLSHGSLIKPDFHWWVFPTDLSSIKARFGKDFKVDKIYLIQKK